MEPLSITNYKKEFLPYLWKTLDYPTLIQLCQTSKEYLKICHDYNTWVYLLKRDFNISWEVQPSMAQEYYKMNYLYFKSGNFFRQLLFSPSESDNPQDYLYVKNNIKKRIRGDNIYQIIEKIIANKIIDGLSIMKTLESALPVNMIIDIRSDKKIRDPLYDVMRTPFSQFKDYIPTKITLNDTGRIIETYARKDIISKSYRFDYILTQSRIIALNMRDIAVKISQNVNKFDGMINLSKIEDV